MSYTVQGPRSLLPSRFAASPVGPERKRRRRPALPHDMSRVAFLAVCLGIADASFAARWQEQWPNTDFSSHIVPLSQISSGGPPKDGIPAIDSPTFRRIGANVALPSREPVIVVAGETTKAYPLRILLWHEIVNDEVDGVPILVTYCPLCNSSIVFRRTFEKDGRRRTPRFGVSGLLRGSDMVMYDRESESLWQQFTGTAIVGDLAGSTLMPMASQVMPYGVFASMYPEGLILEPPTDSGRRYGQTPYFNYDSSDWPFLYKGGYDGPIPALAYVVAVGTDAWPLERLRTEREIRSSDLRIRWQEGMASALDERRLEDGADIGFVSVTRLVNGVPKPVPHVLTFAFAFKQFVPEGTIHHRPLRF